MLLAGDEHGRQPARPTITPTVRDNALTADWRQANRGLTFTAALIRLRQRIPAQPTIAGGKKAMATCVVAE